MVPVSVMRLAVTELVPSGVPVAVTRSPVLMSLNEPVTAL